MLVSPLLALGVLAVLGAAAPRAGGDETRVTIFGAYTNLRYTEEHAYGYVVKVWRTGNGLVGLFSFTDGAQADFDTGTLDNVKFDSATGRVAFDAYDGEFHFSGTLTHETLSGRLTRRPPAGVKASATTKQVRLARTERSVAVMREYDSYEEWKKDADAILRRLGPKRGPAPDPEI